MRGTTIGDYRIERELARTRHAVTYLARHAKLDRPVQIKVLAGNQVFRGADQQFLREAQILDRLRHPGVARVFECGAVDGQAWFATEHLTGATLAEVIAGGARIDVARVILELAAIVEHAHRAGIAHRNLRAENVVCVADGNDFRLVIDGWAGAREIAAMPSDAPADVHALGLIALQLLGGVMAFSSGALAMLATRSVSARFPRAPRPVTALVDRMLSRDVRVRPAMATIRDEAATIVIVAMRTAPANDLVEHHAEATVIMNVAIG